MRGVSGLLITMMALPASGYVGDVNPSGQYRRWFLNPPDPRVPSTAVDSKARAIVYHLDAAGFSTTNTAAELDAVRAAFDQWQGVSGTMLQFKEGAVVSNTQDVNSQDGMNTVFWTRKLQVNGGRENLSGVVALTYVAAWDDNNAIADADTVFNAVQYKWFTDFTAQPPQSLFVEAIALHEIGHFVGLKHSPVGGATMLFVGDFGVNTQVGLSKDEIAAARVLYGTAETSSGDARLTGTVKASGAPVFGAAVIVTDGDGGVLAGTVTRSNGVYEIGGLPPGMHTVRAAPLDPPNGINTLIRGSDITASYATASTQFLPSPDAPVTLAAGQVSTVDLEVVAGQPMRIARLLRPVADLSVFSTTSKPFPVQPVGQTLYVGVLTDSALSAGAVLTVPGDGVEVGPTEVRPNALANLNLAAAPVTFATDATPGLRSVRLQQGDAAAWANGFLEILPAFPDVNADGLDDRFQRRYWTRFTAAEAAPTADPDDDGFDNAWEEATGSVPTNRLSARFIIESVRLTAEGARVTTQTAAGKRFQLFGRATVEGGDWQAIGDPVTASGPETEFHDPTATALERFYRVRMIP